MKIEDRDDFVDAVAQAVIDRIEERDRIAGMVEMVVRRVIELQKQEAELSAKNGDSGSGKQRQRRGKAVQEISNGEE